MKTKSQLTTNIRKLKKFDKERRKMKSYETQKPFNKKDETRGKY